jgi:hypothetical protein
LLPPDFTWAMTHERFTGLNVSMLLCLESSRS